MLFPHWSLIFKNAFINANSQHLRIILRCLVFDARVKECTVCFKVMHNLKRQPTLLFQALHQRIFAVLYHICIKNQMRNLTQDFNNQKESWITVLARYMWEFSCTFHFLELVPSWILGGTGWVARDSRSPGSQRMLHSTKSENLWTDAKSQSSFNSKTLQLVTWRPSMSAMTWEKDGG